MVNVRPTACIIYGVVSCLTAVAKCIRGARAAGALRHVLCAFYLITMTIERASKLRLPVELSKLMELRKYPKECDTNNNGRQSRCEHCFLLTVGSIFLYATHLGRKGDGRRSL